MTPRAFYPLRLRERLLQHGVVLNPGLATCPDWMPAPMQAVHRCFDGFDGWDCETLIEMWSAEKIEAERAGFADRIGPGSLVIGDYSIFANAVVVDGGDLCRPVRYLEGGTTLAPSYELFWDELLSERPSWYGPRR